ncbi:competence protein ComK [Fredinandcohnia sp. QZ13]|uniref:competence protein ComK n=1 Tax=Fredinandcohnia sp. QZ13 TaxID=3073144 RepID=UPI0028536BAC|nr:competence protein ComK [Fredinandcohnia sp. QZ13]MDR4890076.1 competence protein ComK [Fredinandcohnia sp. QZ13]
MKTIQQFYEVNPHTMAILPAREIEYFAIVIEVYKIFYVLQTPLQIIQAACLEGGATYEGRRKAVTHLTGAVQKVPIPINPRRKIFAFPTHSPTAFECNWIFHHHVKTIRPSEKNNPTTQSIILFKNNQELPMNESHYILQKQLTRTGMCILQYSTPEYL